MNNAKHIDFRRLAVSLALAGGFVLLSVEIRFEHRAALTESWRPWIPIVYSAIMPVLILFEVVSDKIATRRMLIGAYILTIGVGLLGVYFHADGKFVQRISELLYVLTASIEKGSEIPARHAPILAPLSFVGLGFLGILMMCEKNNSSIVAEDSNYFVSGAAKLIRDEAA